MDKELCCYSTGVDIIICLQAEKFPGILRNGPQKGILYYLTVVKIIRRILI